MTAKADKPDKPDRTVAGMQVLSDIRGLLTKTQGTGSPAVPPTEKHAGSDARIARLQKEVSSYKDRVAKQQAELDRLRSERDALAARPGVAGPGKGRTQQPDQTGRSLSDEINALEERKAELVSALAGIEGLLQIKTQDLLRRLANLYEEAGQSDFARELRRGRNGLQDPDNLASFLRALLRE